MAKPAPDATVVTVDDDPSVRRALGRLLRAAGYRVEAYASAEEFLACSLPAPPACVVLDVGMPGLGGLDVQQTLRARGAELPIVFITGQGDIPTSVRAMKAGAVDFLTKPFHEDELLAAIEQALRRDARAADAEAAELRRRYETLSPRECEVMALIVSGMLNKQAGRRLGVCEKTVKAHRARVMHKMGAASFAELVRMAGRLGPSSLGAALARLDQGPIPPPAADS